MPQCCSRRVRYATDLEAVVRLLGIDAATADVPAAVAGVVAERDRLRALVLALAGRVAGQSELLARRSEK